MQSLWKHRHAVLERGPSGHLGRVGLLLTGLFQVVLPLLAPMVDVYLVYGLVFLDPVTTGAIWAVALLLQLTAGVVAFRLEGEPLRGLLLLPLQQIVYRQLMYAVLIQSVASAIAGPGCAGRRSPGPGGSAPRPPTVLGRHRSSVAPAPTGMRRDRRAGCCRRLCSRWLAAPAPRCVPPVPQAGPSAPVGPTPAGAGPVRAAPAPSRSSSPSTAAPTTTRPAAPTSPTPTAGTPPRAAPALADPVTLATDPRELPPGTVVYDAAAAEVLRHGGRLDACISEWGRNHHPHVDLWTAGPEPGCSPARTALTPPEPGTAGDQSAGGPAGRPASALRLGHRAVLAGSRHRAPASAQPRASLPQLQIERAGEPDLAQDAATGVEGADGPVLLPTGAGVEVARGLVRLRVSRRSRSGRRRRAARLPPRPAAARRARADPIAVPPAAR